MTTTWQFFQYPGVDWEGWYDGLSPSDKAKHDDVFQILEQRSSWRDLPYVAPLKGGEKIVEIKVKGSVQWRLMGFYGPGRHAFTITMICNHKGRVYAPPNAIPTSVSRKKEIERNQKKEVACERPGKDS